MWYHIRYAYNLLLTAFLIVGVLLMGLGGAIVALLLIGLVISTIQWLLGYDLLLTHDIVYGAGVFVVLTAGLGCILGELGLGATHPDYLKKTR